MDTPKIMENEPDLLAEMAKSEVEKQLEEQVLCLKEKLEESLKQQNSMKYRLEQAHDNESKQANLIRVMEESHRKEIRFYERQLTAAENKQLQSVVWPCVAIAIFAVLSLLTGTCANRGWMVSLLAEILICGELCACTFFVGIVWNRLRDNKAIVNEKKQQALSIGREMLPPVR